LPNPRDGRRRIICIAGVRPNFMKVGALLRAMEGHPRLEGVLVHTGQHFDAAMSDSFFADLKLPEPAVHLRVGPDHPARQTARMIAAFEDALPSLTPDLVLVVGDANSTLACALAAMQCRVPVVHVEAGLRSFDRAMPEELNRILTDQIADMLFVTEQSGIDNLKREGIPDSRVAFTGNTMIDTLAHLMPRIDAAGAAARLGLEAGGYAVVTLHRPSNVDDPARLAELVELLHELSAKLPVVFPVHPRTRGTLERAGLLAKLEGMSALRVLGPQPYIDFLSLTKTSRFVLTDSGGIQEETTYLGVPCITARTSTERPVTTEIGTNVLVGEDLMRSREAIDRVLAGQARKGQVPPLWDGHSAERTVKILEQRFA
jgi:UDP-N-acetylglucosamine 2-epimerase (non-hydrolysing)